MKALIFHLFYFITHKYLQLGAHLAKSFKFDIMSSASGVMLAIKQKDQLRLPQFIIYGSHLLSAEAIDRFGNNWRRVSRRIYLGFFLSGYLWTLPSYQNN
jgi:hypothetical protein